MDTEVIEEAFRDIGARVELTHAPEPGWSDRRPRTRRNERLFRLWGRDEVARPIVVDVKRDEHGEYFDVRHRRVELQIPDCAPSDRHLLLVAYVIGRRTARERVSFLCGRDERHWFVAAVPESSDVQNVQAAKDALKPQEVWDAMREFGVPMDRRNRRRTAGFARQGEWFFIPRREVKVLEGQVLHDEPIRRGAGKPHMCQFLHQTNGQEVFVSDRHPNGLTADEVSKLPEDERDGENWRRMLRNARVFVRGAVRHPDHSTLWLAFWHEVVMNTETQARAMQHVAFLD